MSSNETEQRWGSRLLVVCALAVTLLIVRREFFASQAPTGTPSDRPIEHWEELLSGGHRIGPVNAKVTIIEFADFECPACKIFVLGTLRPVLAKYPNDVAVEFHHWPLAYHRFALPAARAADCASEQGQFESLHYLLYEKQDSLGLKSFTDYATEAGVADVAAFDSCLRNRQEFPKIDRGTESALAIDAHGTPAIIVGGNLLGKIPTLGELESLVERELARALRQVTP